MWATLHLLVLLAIPYFIHGSPTDHPVPLGMEPATFGLTGRIVNGTKAVLRQFPYQVSLKRSLSRKHFCGGTIISTSLVLTAGHCMYLGGNVIQPWTIIVVGGIVHLYNEVPSRQEQNVRKITIHPMFNLTTLHNDIAILQLLKHFTFIPELHSAPLPGHSLVPNTVCQIAGWGYHSSHIPIVFPDLMYVNLPIRTIQECRKLLENATDLPPGMYCAGYLEGGMDACNGDSGSGMICNGILTGIVSGGSGCAEPLLPGVYVDIFYYLDWIIGDTDAVVIQELIDPGNSGAFNMSAIMIVIISLFFCTVINYS